MFIVALVNGHWQYYLKNKIMTSTRLVQNMLAAFAIMVGLPLFSQSIFINEFLASNNSTLADEFGGYDDWVELYNAGSTAADIGGMYVTDKLSNPTKWQIPSTDPAKTTIPPGGFLLLWFDEEPMQGALHINAKLGAGGEDIGLFAPNGSTPIDALVFGPQSIDVSYGRIPDGGNAFEFFSAPTPGATNLISPGGNPTEAPLASIAGGFYNNAIEVALTTATTNAEIRYTLNGSEPNATSPFYIAPLQITETTTLRARAFAAGLLPSAIATYTYFLNINHTFPVVALSFKEEDFFDSVTGIYPNYMENWERPVHVEFFEEDNSTAFSQNASVEIHGTGSASNPQKSLKLKSLGGKFHYPIFTELPFEEYNTFLLRNAGQDWNITMFRDAFVTSLAREMDDVGNIILPPKLHLQAFRPGLVYLNGQYWGIHNLREQMTEEWVEAHLGLNENEMDFLDDDEAKAGSFDSWNFLLGYLGANDFSDNARLAELGTFIDLPHFLDYAAFSVLVDNADWPGKNFRRWRPNGNNGLWQFMTFDLDLSFGLLNHLPGGNTWNTGEATSNSLTRLLDSTSSNWPNPWWATLPFRKVMENETFRRDFINRTADFLNVLFSPQRVNARIDEFTALYEPEIQAHYDKWSPGWNPWQDNLALLRKFADERPDILRQHFVDHFHEASGTATVTLQVEPAGSGSIQFSTLNLGADRLPWSGEYFTGVDIPVRAVPAPGYVFVGWSKPGMGNMHEAIAHFTEDETLIAYFEMGSTSVENIVINEINYNSPSSPNSGDWVELFNPNSNEVDISGWVLLDESAYFSTPNSTVLQPNSYLLLVENEAAFKSAYPWASNYLGSFGDGVQGFKLSNDSELIQLKNAKLDVIDSVRYDDELPWPVDADGTGKTLQLVSHLLDNALPSSWKANAPTPGVTNLSAPQIQSIDFQPIPDKFTIDQPFALMATASSGLAVVFTILSGPASLNGNLLALNGTAGTVTVMASQAGNADWQAALPVVQSFSVKHPPSYCNSRSDKPWWEWIERVQFGDINHPSFKKQYGNFIHIATPAPIGSTMDLSITPAFSWDIYEEFFRAWIDFNRDGDFDDNGELVLEEQGTSKVTVPVLIPDNAELGTTRMRVSMRRGEYAEACEDFELGEVEDYTVIITQPGSFLPDGNEGQDSEDVSLNINPNPVVSTLGVHFFTQEKGAVQATVISSQGVHLKKETMRLSEGEHFLEMDVSNLPEGSYRLFLQTENQKPKSGGFVKIRP